MITACDQGRREGGEGGEWVNVPRKTARFRLLRKNPPPTPGLDPAGVDNRNSAVSDPKVEDKRIEDSKDALPPSTVEDLVGPPIIMRPMVTSRSQQLYLQQRQPDWVAGVPLSKVFTCNHDSGLSPSVAGISPSLNHHCLSSVPPSIGHCSQFTSVSSSMLSETADWPSISCEGEVGVVSQHAPAWSDAVKRPAQVKQVLKKVCPLTSHCVLPLIHYFCCFLLQERDATAAAGAVVGGPTIDDACRVNQQGKSSKKNRKKNKNKSQEEQAIKREPLMFELDTIFQALEVSYDWGPRSCM